MIPRIRCPAIFGDYALLRPLAQDRVEGVYLATTRSLAEQGEACVVKVRRVPPDRLMPAFADVRHANIARIIDRGTERDQAFAVVEWRTSRDLDQIWTRCAQMRVPIPVPVACRIMVDVLSGLAAMHAISAGHYQLCPAKILVGGDGVTTLAEGSLRFAAHGLQLGSVAGRAGYLAPEQLAGGGRGPAADTYAAGVILWELLTLRTLWLQDLDGRQGIGMLIQQVAHLRARIARVQVGLPSAENPRIPSTLDAPVLRALASDPRQRFANAREFLEGLTGTGVPVAKPVDVASFMTELFGQELAEERRQIRALVRQCDLLVRLPGAEPVREPAWGHRRDLPAQPAKPEYPIANLEDRPIPELPRPSPPRRPVADSKPPAQLRKAGAEPHGRSRLVLYGAAAVVMVLAGGALLMRLLGGGLTSASPSASTEDQPQPGAYASNPPGPKSIPDDRAVSSGRPTPSPPAAIPAPTAPRPAAPTPAPAPIAAARLPPANTGPGDRADDPKRPGERHPSRADRERRKRLLNEAQDAYDHGNFTLAIRKGTEAVDAGGGSEAHLVMGDAYLSLRNWAHAASAYRKVLKKDPASENARIGLEKAVKNLGDSR